MKKALLVLIVVLIPAMTLAENPDSRPSIYLSIGGNLLSGKRSFKLPAEIGESYRKYTQDQNGEAIGIKSILTWPVSANSTLVCNISYQRIRFTENPTEIYSEIDDDLRRFSFEFGMRFYIGQSINK